MGEYSTAEDSNLAPEAFISDRATGRAAAVAGGERGCFTFSTVVRTEHGEHAIGTLQVGERVLAYNPKTGKMEYEPIRHVWINHDDDLVDLTITTTTKGEHGKAATKASEVVHTNQKHPFLTIEDGFVPVGKLKPGMHVLRADGQVGVITGWKVVAGSSVMYNLEVAQDHTYTVGVGQWVVHNMCPTGPVSPGDAGAYGDLKGEVGDDLTPHHMPQGSLARHFGFDYEKGGTIVMDTATHKLTYNYGGRGIATANSIISSGLTFRQALAESIWDYRSLVPDSNSSIRDLIEYWRSAYPSLMQK